MVPRDPRANVGYRWQLMEMLRDKPETHAGISEMCRQDVLFWINSFVWQYNPDHPHRRVAPFVTWPKQDKCILAIVDHIHRRRDLILEKSRYQGASWIVVDIFDWLQRYHPWTKTHMVSRKEDLVDSVSDESLFWKLDFIDEWMPDFMKLNLKGTRDRQAMYRRNPANNALMTGEATTKRAGVGARATNMLMDEFAQIQQGFEILHRTTETTHCRIFVSTHVGQDTAFFQICQSGAIDKVVLHWTDHPEQSRGLYRYEEGKVVRYDKSYVFPEDYKFVTDGKPSGGPMPGFRSPWYDAQCERKGSSRAVAMDLDIDPEGSVSQFFDPITINSLRRKFCTPPMVEGDLLHDESGNYTKFEPRSGGVVKLWCRLDVYGNPPVGVYGAGADISTGEGASPSCFSLADSVTGDKLVEVATSRMRPVDFANLCVALCRWFGDALFAWEQQGPGATFGNRVMELGYRRVYYKADDLAYGSLKPTWYRSSEEKPGWYPSPAGKRLLLDEYSKALAKHQFLNRSDQALKECLAFKYNSSGNPEHAGEKSDDPAQGTVNHGDRVIADALCRKMINQLVRPTKVEKKEETISVLSLAWRRKYHEEKDHEEESA